MKINRLSLAIAAFCISGISMSAQQTSTGSSNQPSAAKPNISPTKSQEMDMYKFRKSRRWTVGVLTGTTLFHGDAERLKPGFTIGPYLKYSVSQTFALRGEFNNASVKGARDIQSPTLYKDFFEFTSKVKDFNLQMLFTLGNISHLRPMRKHQLYLFVGLGQTRFRSKASFIDQRVFSSDYYLSNYFGQGTPNPHYGQRVEEEFEGNYFNVPVGLGMKFKLGQRLDLSTEVRYTYLRSDDMDVFNTMIWQNRKWDSYSFIRLGLGYKFGSGGSEHYDWLNTTSSLYDEIANIKEKTDCLGKDRDNDHVPDCFDQDNNTPDSCMVYGNGMAVDSDSDGVPDCQDQEPFSIKGAEVDPITGKAIDSDMDGVPDIIDLELNSSPGALVDAHGIEVEQGVNCTSSIFNSIIPNHINLSQLDKQNLFLVAEKMKQCPSTKLKVVAPGGKSSKYSAPTAAKLMKKIVDYLVEFYGVSRDRILVDHKGTGNNSKGISLKTE